MEETRRDGEWPRPNLFVIGAMKAGTTSLHALLDSHPDVFMSDPKEPTHFVDGDELRSVSRRAWEAGYWRDRDRYLDLFSQGDAAAIRGESSTAYAKRPRLGGVPERIAAHAPGARIVYILRDPIRRTVSHYLHAVQWNDEHRPPLEAVREDPHYREVSHYAMQLEPWRRILGPDRIHVMTLESLKARPVEMARELFEWLGVDPTQAPPRESPRNVTRPDVARKRGPALLRRARTSAPVRALKRRLPWTVRELARRVLDEPVGWGSGRMDALVDYLRPIQLAETAVLEEMLERTFPEWTTLDPPTREDGPDQRS